jgi:N6-adenosine-specific RNA methylase IME4/predicted transcriptional regulator
MNTLRPESPDTVHGRLLESAHVSGYTFERACGELEWLLDDDRWKQVGGGYTDINAFLATIDFSEFRFAIDRRRKLVKRLAEIEATQTATARLLGVHEATVRADLGKRKAPSGNPEVTNQDHQDPTETSTDKEARSGNPEAVPAWFQSDADPSREAKRVTRNIERDQERQQTRAARPTRSLPDDEFTLLYVDPPWRYEHIETESRAIENQYPTMGLDEICALKIPAALDAVLFLWATSPKLAEAVQVIEAWGFNYRTCAVWDKETIGMGYYFRQQHELLLVAVRGSVPVPEPSARPSSVLRSKRGKHSAKPTLVYDLIERMYPHFTEQDRVELFAREKRRGWSNWGNDPAVAV